MAIGEAPLSLLSRCRHALMICKCVVYCKVVAFALMSHC